MQPHALLQILPRASKECRLLVVIQPTVSFFIAQSLAADKYCTSLPATDKSSPMFQILLAMVKGFAKEDFLTSGIADPAVSKDLLTISPQQVLPFTMDLTAPPKRHLIPPKVEGALKTLVMLTQLMGQAVECYAHLEPKALEAQAKEICNPTQEELQTSKQWSRPVGVNMAEDAADTAAGDKVPVAVSAEATAEAAAEPTAEATVEATAEAASEAAAEAAAESTAEATAEDAAALPAASHDSEISKIPDTEIMQTMADVRVDCEAGEQPL